MKTKSSKVCFRVLDETSRGLMMNLVISESWNNALRTNYLILVKRVRKTFFRTVRKGGEATVIGERSQA